MISWNPMRRISVAALILALALAAACSSSNPASPGSTAAVTTSSATNPGTGSGPTSGPTPGSTGTLRVMLKDSPFSEASAVLVTFDGVSVHRSGGDWESLQINGGPVVRTCDLKKLQGPQEVLGTAVLTAGHYTQIRLMVASATIYRGGTKIPGEKACAETPAELAPTQNSDPKFSTDPVVVAPGEIKLNREFDLTAGGTTTIELDFDGEKSINQTGNGKYMMKPVISVLNVNVVSPQ